MTNEGEVSDLLQGIHTTEEFHEEWDEPQFSEEDEAFRLQIAEQRRKELETPEQKKKDKELLERVKKQMKEEQDVFKLPKKRPC